MTHEIFTTITMAAPRDDVWAALLDFASYPGWNPFVRSIQGTPIEGSLLRVRIQPPGSRVMTFRPVVVRARPAQELRWRGKLLIDGLFDGEHYFLLDSTGRNSTRFAQGERFSGLLVPCFGIRWMELQRPASKP